MLPVYAEIAHWLHQKGDTIGFTRLCSCKKWGLKNMNFEKPVVIKTADDVCEMSLGAGIVLTDDLCYESLLFNQLYKIPGQRIRIYECVSLRIMNNIVQLCSIGNMPHLDDLFANNKFVNIPLLLNTSHVKTLQCTFMYSVYNQPLFWDLRNVYSLDNLFYNSLYNQPIDWHTPRLQFAVGMFAFNKMFNSPVKISTKNLINASYMFCGASSFNQEIVWEMPFLLIGYSVFPVRPNTKRILVVVPANIDIHDVFGDK